MFDENLTNELEIKKVVSEEVVDGERIKEVGLEILNPFVE